MPASAGVYGGRQKNASLSPPAPPAPAAQPRALTRSPPAPRRDGFPAVRSPGRGTANARRREAVRRCDAWRCDAWRCDARRCDTGPRRCDAATPRHPSVTARLGRGTPPGPTHTTGRMTSFDVTRPGGVQRHRAARGAAPHLRRGPFAAAGQVVARLSGAARDRHRVRGRDHRRADGRRQGHGCRRAPDARSCPPGTPRCRRPAPRAG